MVAGRDDDRLVRRPAALVPRACIGDLAVNGTVNDLAMMGARPLYLTVGFVPRKASGRRTRPHAEVIDRATRASGVTIVAGDAKVVDRGQQQRHVLGTAASV